MTTLETVLDRKSPPPYWQLLRCAIDALGGCATAAQLKAYVLERRPEAKPAVLNGQITIVTVNSRSRVHYAQNANPRVCNGHLDVLFSTGKGCFERYESVRHGLWAIESEGEDLVVKRIKNPSMVV